MEIDRIIGSLKALRYPVKRKENCLFYIEIIYIIPKEFTTRNIVRY
jgi:hypothetical protein